MKRCIALVLVLLALTGCSKAESQLTKEVSSLQYDLQTNADDIVALIKYHKDNLLEEVTGFYQDGIPITFYIAIADVTFDGVPEILLGGSLPNQTACLTVFDSYCKPMNFTFRTAGNAYDKDRVLFDGKIFISHNQPYLVSQVVGGNAIYVEQTFQKITFSNDSFLTERLEGITAFEDIADPYIDFPTALSVVDFENIEKSVAECVESYNLA